MKKKSVLILCAVLLCLTSCASTRSVSKHSVKKNNGKFPIWIQTPYEVYDSEKYFVGVGNDINKNIAELKAVQQLSVVFGVDVQSTNTTETYMKHTESEVLSETFRESALNQQILVEMDQKDLLGIELVETFYEEVHKEWYALAILDKAKTSDLYANLINSNNDAIRSNLAFAKTMPDSLTKLAYIYKSYKLAQVSENFFIRFYIINPERCSKIKEASYVSEKIKLDLDKLALKIPVEIEVNQDSNSMVRAACGELLESFGLQTTSNKSDYTLSVNIDKTYRTVKNPTLYYCEFQISCELIDKNGLILAPWQLSSRAGAKTESLAEQKAYQLINKNIKEDYRDSFESYLYGEIK